jgi:hypothetical protein
VTAVFCTKPHNRLLRPLTAAGQARAPPELGQAAQEEALLAREHTPDRADLVIDGMTGTLAARSPG